MIPGSHYMPAATINTLSGLQTAREKPFQPSSKWMACKDLSTDLLPHNKITSTIGSFSNHAMHKKYKPAGKKKKNDLPP